MPLLARQQKKLNEAHEQRLQVEVRAEVLKSNILRLQAQEAELDAVLSAVHHAAPKQLHAAQKPLPALCQPMHRHSSLSLTACKPVAGKEARVPGRLQTPNANQSMLYDSKDMRQGKTSMVASHVCSTMAGSSSSIKAACQCHNTAMRPTTSCRDAKDNHSKTSRLFSCRALPVQSCFTPAQGSTASDPGSSKGSRKIANTSDSTEHGVSDTVSNPTGSVAKGKQCADSIPTVVQAGSHSLLSSSNSTDDCKGSFCIDDQTPQQLLQENAEKYQPVQAQQTSAMSCRAHATAQQDLTTRNDTAHGLQGQQAHVPQWQQQQLQVHKDTPQSSDRPAHQTMVSPPRQVGLRRLTGQYSYSGGVTGSGRTVVRTLSQSGNPAAHMMQRLD